MTRPAGLLALALGLAVMPPAEGRAQAQAPWVRPVEPLQAPVPFEVGEFLEYKVKLGILNAGEGSLEVAAIEAVRGTPAYRAVMRIDGGVLFARVRDVFQTWFDTRTLTSLRFIQDQNEVGSKRYRHYEMFPERGVWERRDDEEVGDLPTTLPLDDISFVYFIRTLPLEVGDVYTFNRYFKDTGNPVIVRVLRKEEKEVPAGIFKTIVVQPIIRTRGLFGQGGKAELYFSDDDRRALVYMRSSVPLVGSLTLHLTSPPAWQPQPGDTTGEDGETTGSPPPP